jgi:hypothetical protein
MKHTKLTFLAAALAVTAAGASHAANFQGGSSNTGYVAVGASTVNGGPHHAGFAGVAVNSTGLGNPVDFTGLTAYSTQSTASVDYNRDGVSDGTATVYGLNFPYSGAPTTHDNLGVFSFAKVGSQDVWFGEWNSRKDTADGLATHTVYYIGDNADTSVPTSGTATYNVAGINNFSGANLLSGTFTANFATAKLTGTIANSAGFSVNIGSANINSNASISGTTAVALQSGAAVATGGAVSGQFYSNQTALAGMATFANNQYSTAFGGTKK